MRSKLCSVDNVEECVCSYLFSTGLPFLSLSRTRPCVRGSNLKQKGPEFWSQIKQGWSYRLIIQRLCDLVL